MRKITKSVLALLLALVMLLQLAPTRSVVAWAEDSGIPGSELNRIDQACKKTPASAPARPQTAESAPHPPPPARDYTVIFLRRPL